MAGTPPPRTGVSFRRRNTKYGSRADISLWSTTASPSTRGRCAALRRLAQGFVGAAVPWMRPVNHLYYSHAASDGPTSRRLASVQPQAIRAVTSPKNTYE